MRRKSPKISQYKNIIKGRIFEFVLADLIKKAGFILNPDIPQLTKFGKRKKVHGRGGTYNADFIAEFPITIPFSYPFLLLGEAKYYKKPLGIKEVRSFLGAFIDVSQYSRINTKSRSLFKYSQIFLDKRYTYIPVIFSSGGFVKNAQALMWTHGIYFISYENLPIINKIRKNIDLLIKNINFNKLTKDEIKKIDSLEGLSTLDNSIKKEKFDEYLKKLKDNINPIKSYFGILDDTWPVHFLSTSKSQVKPSSKIKRCSFNLNENKLIIKKTTHKNSTTAGIITLPKYFLKEYEKISSKKEKSILKELVLFIPKDNKIFPYYIKLERIKNETKIKIKNSKIE